MLKRFPIGIKDYRKLALNNYYFVDKSLMIKELLDGGSEVTLVTRPRRFGKTLNISMLTEFFDITKESQEIFKDTKIMKTEYVSEMNQYPTIFISFASAKKEKSDTVQKIKDEIMSEWERYYHVFDNMTELQQSTYTRLKNILLGSNENLNGIGDAIAFLMEMLYKYYHKKVMVFIDEYDTPFIEAYVNGFYKEVNNGLSLLLHNALKASDYLQCAVLTGIQRVAKENIFSDLNNVEVCTVANNQYSSYFGFSEEETKELLGYYGLDLNEEVKDMYDGYRIGNQDIYNPWSLINYVKQKELISYWVNTSANTMIKQSMDKTRNDIKKEFETLIENKEMTTKVSLETSFYEQANGSTLWGLLVNAGYLTIENVVSAFDGRYTLRVPNKEVKSEFLRLTEHYLGLNENKIDNMLYYLISEDKEGFLELYKSILLQYPSYHDLRSENSYHVFMLGLCAWLPREYEVISNREEGKGRCDLILKSHKENKTSFVFEFKYTKEEDLEELAHKAVQQIKEKKYDLKLTGKVIYIGLAHKGKEVEMEWIERE